MSKNLFNSITVKKPKRNHFDLTHDVKLSLNMGELIPTLCMECVPGDSFKIGCESILRFLPLIAPVIHRFNVFMHYYFVPNRILWNSVGSTNGGWETWITGNSLAGPTGRPGEPVFPYVLIGGPAGSNNYSRLADYLGVPNPGNSNPNNEYVSALPFAAYQKIYDDYYRDQNLIDPLFLPTNAALSADLTDGDNTTTYNSVLSVLRKRAWEHDYFTSCLPYAQKGNAVALPLGKVVLDPDSTAPGRFVTAATHAADNWTGGLASDGAAGQVVLASGAPKLGTYDPQGSLTVGATTINDLRRAERLQEWLEKNARAGTRYVESIRAHFGVNSSDKRLQRPEYICGTKSPVVISEIVNTTGTTDLPQGNMSGHGISVTSGGYGSYFCEEHGWIIGIMSVMPKTAYQNGLPRAFSKGVPGGATDLNDNRFAMFWPEFANIGEQEVYQREIFAFAGSTDKTVFGYVPRYAEYKYMPSRTAGDMRTSLSFWTFTRNFTSAPSLNQQFVECSPDYSPFAVYDPTTQHLVSHVLHKISALRPMPKFGTPFF